MHVGILLEEFIVDTHTELMSLTSNQLPHNLSAFILLLENFSVKTT